MPDRRVWPFDPADPYPGYRAARERAPVQVSEQLGGVLVLSREHAATVLRDVAAFSSDPRNDATATAALGGAGSAEMWSRSLLTSDPPAHTRLRGAVNRFFTPRAAERIRDRVAGIVDAALEPLDDGAPIELMAELAYPIPVAVIAELFDIGLEGAQLVRDETPALTGMLELDPTLEQLETAGAAAMGLMLFLVPLVAERRTNPQDDLLSALVHAPGGGEPLDDDEIINTALLLLAAGHETTANLIGNGVLALLEHPEQLRRLRERPDLAGAAVEEVLRYDSPVQLARRAAVRDVVLGDVAVPRGAQALILLGAANREGPGGERFAIERDEALGHLAFGLGPHFCAGAGLARLEGAQTFARLARSAAAWEDGGWAVERADSVTFRRVSALHLGGPVRPATSPRDRPARTPATARSSPS